MDSVLLRLTARNIKTLYMQFLVVTAAIPFCLPRHIWLSLARGGVVTGMPFACLSIQLHRTQ